MASTSNVNNAVTQYLNSLVYHDHLVGRTNSPPKLVSLADYWAWRGRFEDYIQREDLNMWIMLTEGYEWPTLTVNGVTTTYKMGELKGEEKTSYAVEVKALSTLRMCIPQELVHLFPKQEYKTSKQLFDAIEAHCEGDPLLKQNRIKMLKKQFDCFNATKNEQVEDLIIRYQHLLAELAYFDLKYSPTEVVDKFLDGLPKAYKEFRHGLQERADYASLRIDGVISILRNREMKDKAKDLQDNFTQDPGLYHATMKNPTADSNAFFSGIGTSGKGETSGSHLNGDDFTGFIPADTSNKSRKATDGTKTEYVKFGNVTSSSAG